MNNFYIIQFEKNNNSYFVLWNEETNRIFETNRKLLVTNKKIELYSRAKFEDIIHDEGDVFICDIKILNNSPEDILDFWNIVEDIAKTVEINFMGNEKKMNILYDKLYKKYIGEDIFFTKQEMEILQSIVEDGINIIDKYIINAYELT